MFVDNAIAIRVAYMLVSDYKEWPAFKDGTIDETGKFLQEPGTEAQRDNWTPLHRLVWRIRSLLAKAPGGETKLARLGTTYLLMKEADNYFPMLEDLEEQVMSIIEDSGIANVAGANVGPGEGLGTLKKLKDTTVVRRKSFKEFKKGLVNV